MRYRAIAAHKLWEGNYIEELLQPLSYVKARQAKSRELKIWNFFVLGAIDFGNLEVHTHPLIRTLTPEIEAPPLVP